MLNGTRSLLVLFRTHYAPFTKTGSVILSLLVTGQIIQLSFPYLQGRIIDNLAKESPIAELFIIGAVMIVLYLLMNLIGYFRELYEVRHFDVELNRHVDGSALSRLLAMSLGQHVNEHSGLRFSVIMKGTKALGTIANESIYAITPFFLQIIFASVALIIVTPAVGLLVLTIAGMYLYSVIRYNINFFPKMRADKERWNKQSKRFSDVLRNMRLVKISSKEAEVLEEFHALYRETAAPGKEMWKELLGNWYRRSTFLSVAQVGTLLFGVVLVKMGVDSPGTIVMYVGWMGSVFGNIGNLAWIERNLLTQLAEVEKFERMLSVPPAITAAKDALRPERFSGKIEFRNVSFAYPHLSSLEDDGDDEDESSDAEPVAAEILHQVSFTILPGQTVAIVGHSGAGKSTVVNLLLRAYDPDGGEILVDDVPLPRLDHGHYLSAIGYVPQQVELFDNTLRYNLTFASKEGMSLPESRLEAIAAKTRIDQFYSRLGAPRFDTMIGENGIKLSGGERQRVGIARALLRDPQILLFDEATSSLDAENEALIHEAMDEALRGRTGIIIAHRLSTVRDADLIIVMDEGKVAGVGTHDELLDRCPEYQKLIAHQMVI